MRKLIENYSEAACGEKYTSHTKKKRAISILYENDVDDYTNMSSQVIL